ncbi:hypothetical protein ACKWTF_009117 [Chironomus riparius]
MSIFTKYSRGCSLVTSNNYGKVWSRIDLNLRKVLNNSICAKEYKTIYKMHVICERTPIHMKNILLNLEMIASYKGNTTNVSKILFFLLNILTEKHCLISDLLQ